MNDISILLVSRNESESAITRAALANIATYRIVADCTSSTQAYTLIQLHRPDLVICDMVMGAPDGLWLLKRLQRMPNRPMFLLTSYISSDTALRYAQSYGADYFLLKPCSAQQLRDTIRMLVSERILSMQILPSRAVCAKVQILLTKNGYISNSNGYRYLATAVELIYEHPRLLSSLTKSLYSEIARIHATSTASVERDIRHTIRTTCQRTGATPQTNGNTLRMMLRSLQQMK